MRLGLYNECKDVWLASETELARTPWKRLVGLMGRKQLDQGRALLLEPGNGIHMLFMRFPIDAMFLDRDWQVLHIAHSIRPWRACPFVRRSKRVVEIAAGTCRRTGTEPGNRLVLREWEQG